MFDTKLEEWLDDTRFMVNSVAGLDSTEMDDIKNDQKIQVLFGTEGLPPLMRIMKT